MARSKWTLMLIPHDNERVRSVQVSSSSVRAIVSAGLIAILLAGSFSVGFFVKQSEHLRAKRLERENLLLAAEVDQMRGKMQHLTASLDLLSKKDENIRIIAGLPPLAETAPAVQAVERRRPSGPLPYSVAAVYRLNPRLAEKLFSTSHDLDALIQRSNVLGSSMEQAISTLKRNTERLEATPSIAPADGALSSLFSRNRRHPVMKISRPHKGIDIAARVGEPILAPAKGVVRFSGNRAGGYGRMVEIDHGFGYVTRFAHCSKLLVRQGDVVERGQKIAEVGETGLTSGPHLHYEVEVNGSQVDPLNFIITDVIPD